MWVFWQYVNLYLLCFCIVSFMYIYSYFLLVQGLLPPSGKSIAVNNNSNNNNNNNILKRINEQFRNKISALLEFYAA